ncbi:major facilitator superfamily domain-containing protein [Flammula alnicola]|nr:major facilitator superfamily domain-containing protein [Flammula alnicola]
MIRRLQMRQWSLCFSIALNSFCAGGMFTFPLISPALATHYKLSQPHLTTIILAGMMSQYPVAVIVGSLNDQHGPATCTLIAAALFSTGFGGFSWEIYNTPSDLPVSQASFYRLVFCFLLVGLGTVFSYCSSLFAASKYFPNHIGLASGATMALFGLSPLFYSVIATTFFMDPTTGLLNVVSFTAFLALTTGFVYIPGWLNLRRFPINSTGGIEPNSSHVEGAIAAETTPLLASESTEHPSGRPLDPTVGELLKKVDFWLLAIFCIFTLGMSEMVISNIGTLSESLPPPPYELTSGRSIASSSAAFQVKLISVANTLSRIFVGPLADLVSPVPGYLSTGVQTFPRKHVISRFAFLSGAATLLSLTFLWMEFGVRSQAQLWALSLGTGLGYSTVFTVL